MGCFFSLFLPSAAPLFFPLLFLDPLVIPCIGFFVFVIFLPFVVKDFDIYTGGRNNG